MKRFTGRLAGSVAGRSRASRKIAESKTLFGKMEFQNPDKQGEPTKIMLTSKQLVALGREPFLNQIDADFGPRHVLLLYSPFVANVWRTKPNRIGRIRPRQSFSNEFVNLQSAEKCALCPQTVGKRPKRTALH